MAPGVTTQSSNSSTLPAPSRLRPTGPRTAYSRRRRHDGHRVRRPGKDLNSSSSSVEAGRRLPVEFGRSTGGIVNVITKSGGNEFQRRFEHNAKPTRRRTSTPTNFFGTNEGFRATTEASTPGLRKDRIWFFGAYDRVQGKVVNTLTSGPQEGQLVTSPTVRNSGPASSRSCSTPNQIIGSSSRIPPRIRAPSTGPTP